LVVAGLFVTLGQHSGRRGRECYGKGSRFWIYYREEAEQ